MMVTATLLMGCSGNTSDYTDDSMGKEDIAENADTGTSDSDELGEAMENAILYKYSWSMDGDITAVVIATNYEGTHQFTVGWNGPEY